MCVYAPGVRTLSVAELNERLEEVDTNIRRFSEELVQQLALRDELEFEKEVKNSFISALIDVQNRQKEHRELLKKKKKLKAGAGTSQGHTEKILGSVSTLFLQPHFKEMFQSCSHRFLFIHKEMGSSRLFCLYLRFLQTFFCVL